MKNCEKTNQSGCENLLQAEISLLWETLENTLLHENFTT